ncbi:MAG: hypothetical protein ACI89D_000311 [Bermanella sp.]|jgi:hypothetical protein
MSGLDIVIFFAITSMFSGAALLIVRGGAPDTVTNFQSSLHTLGSKRAS